MNNKKSNPIIEGLKTLVTEKPESMFLLKHQGSYGYERTIRCRCMGKLHKITFRQRGPISLENHKNLEAERTLVRLGGDVPVCIMLLQEWQASIRKEFYHMTIPPEKKLSRYRTARDFYSLAKYWKKSRSKNKERYYDILVDAEYKERLWHRVNNALDEILRRLRYSSKFYNAGECLSKQFQQEIKCSFSGKFKTQKEEEEENE